GRARCSCFGSSRDCRIRSCPTSWKFPSARSCRVSRALVRRFAKLWISNDSDIGFEGGRVKLVSSGGNISLPPTVAGEYFERYGIVGRSRAIADLIRKIDLVAPTRSTVLITGETGTGK